METLQYVEPREIERRSFEIISSELEARSIALDPENELVVKRVIHTTADFDYASALEFCDGATRIGVEALRAGCSIATDTTMALAGVNKRVLAKLGGQAYNFIADEDVAAEAKRRGCTRSAVAMERASSLGVPLVYAIGNAPTALMRLCELIDAGKATLPALVIGVPVGFVNVVESKDLLCQLDVPYIVARGRKGGSNVAAAICNALLYLASNDERE